MVTAVVASDCHRHGDDEEEESHLGTRVVVVRRHVSVRHVEDIVVKGWWLWRLTTRYDRCWYWHVLLLLFFKSATVVLLSPERDFAPCRIICFVFRRCCQITSSSNGSISIILCHLFHLVRLVVATSSCLNLVENSRLFAEHRMVCRLNLFVSHRRATRRRVR